MTDPRTVFHSDDYLAHNDARLTHLAQLLSGMGLNPEGKTVLEVGAGIGDHTGFWLKRGAAVTATEPRAENLEVIRQRFPSINSFELDLDHSTGAGVDKHDIVYAFGVLYHLRNPEGALSLLADKCSEFLFLETCVSYGDELKINLVEEPDKNPSQATSGYGCRPTRYWIFEELKKYFPYVYQPSFQPNHPQFPTDWLQPASERTEFLARAVFIAARRPVNAATFFPRVLDQQTRQTKLDSSAKPGLDGLLARTQFGLVLDVGANQGQFAAKMRGLGHKGPIASFEPMAAAYARLAAAAKGDDLITPYHCALGAQTEQREIFISGNSASSSFLKIEETTVAAEPMTAVVGTETVEVRRLDDVAQKVFSTAQDGPVLLKLDTQGTEREVLEGAEATLQNIDFILSECSLISVYEGEPLIESQIDWMRSKGFDPISMELGWSDPQTGHTYQIDILFKRR